MTIASQVPPARSQLLGYPVDSLDIDEAVRRVGTFIKTGGFHHVVAINANKLWLAEKCPELRKILWNADLIVPEYAVVWASRQLRKPLKGHVGGVMLLKALMPYLEKERVPAFFLGAKTNVLEQMKIQLRASHPQLVMAGLRSGYFDPDQEQGIVQQINHSGAEVLFVAMGTPRQELWVERHRQSLGVKVVMGVGGSFDVLAGIKKDAPQWVRHGGEWLYRLVQDPRNLWKRYLTTNPWFVYRVFRERILPHQAPGR
ncbi:MAG TPA: WecB/TagA/CpsF family glycosyltransferase [Terriglobales bacterium]|nr:WecB/TagA/CpsF family glycosyltransferase [Terriglobales bacterium]